MTWTYDGQSHLAGETRSGGYGPFHDAFTLDGVGNRSQLTNIYGTFSFLYDADDRLYNYANGAYTFGYNDNGDMTTSTLNGHVSTLSYDYDDQLTGISSQAGTVTYGYDALGRRVYRQDATGSTHSFIYDGAHLVGEYGYTSGAWDTEYTYGLSLLDKQGSGGTEFVFYNGLGDTYGLTTPTGQTLLGDVWDDFGQSFGGIQGTNDLSYQWRSASGYRADGDGLWTGSYNEPLVEVGARYYIPSMGVFITRDTDLSQRPYEYCNADPVNNVDSSGNDSSSTTTTKNPDGTTTQQTITYRDNGTVVISTVIYNTSNPDNWVAISSQTSILTNTQSGVVTGTIYGNSPGLPASVSLSVPAGPGTAAASITTNFLGPISPIGQLSYGLGPVSIGVNAGPNSTVGGFITINFGFKY